MKRRFSIPEKLFSQCCAGVPVVTKAGRNLLPLVQVYGLSFPRPKNDNPQALTLQVFGV